MTSALALSIQKRLAEIRAIKAIKATSTNQSHEQQSPSISTLSSHSTDNTDSNSSPSQTIASNPVTSTESVHAAHTDTAGTDHHGNVITYNPEQQRAIDLIASGQSCVIIGAAGTGKTTIQKGATQKLIQEGTLQRLRSSDHKYLKSGTYGIIICAYTRRATNNIRKNLSADLQNNTITIHKTLEYEPVEYWVDGRQTRRFEPQRTATNPLPEDVQTIIIEESSMVSLELYKQLEAAAPPNTQFIFLGDIQQLPPVFGSAILGYKMLTLPVVELTHVHRQALDSPILSLAHRILSGTPLPAKAFHTLNTPHKLTLHAWKKRIEPDSATQTLAKFFLAQLDHHLYDPAEHAILIPFNKSCGTDELNKHLATGIARKEFRAVHEIIHGWKRSYYSVGDKCLYDKEDAIITAITPNPLYSGIDPREPSQTLDYWGNGSESTVMTDDIDSFLSTVSAGPEDEERTQRAASHTIKLTLLDSERTVSISSAGEIDALNLGYAITVHKSQGSEWPKVYLCLHHSHSMMVQRELLYTAVTRAKQELFVICESDTFEKGIIRQRIPGATWQEKSEHFKGRVDRGEQQS